MNHVLFVGDTGVGAAGVTGDAGAAGIYTAGTSAIFVSNFFDVGDD